MSASAINNDTKKVHTHIQTFFNDALPEMATFPLHGSLSSIGPASDDLRVTFCMTWASFILCSSDMYAMMRVLQVCRLFAASSAWSFWEQAASSLQAPSRIRISWSIFFWMSLSCEHKKRERAQIMNDTFEKRCY